MKIPFTFLAFFSALCVVPMQGAAQEFSDQSMAICPATIEEKNNSVLIVFENLDPRSLDDRKVILVDRQVQVETEDRTVTRSKKHLHIELPSLGMSITVKKDGDFVCVETNQTMYKEVMQENNGYTRESSSTSSFVSSFVKGGIDIKNATVEVNGSVLVITIPKKIRLQKKNL